MSSKIYLKPGVKLSRVDGDKTVCIAPETLTAIYAVAQTYYAVKTELSAVNPKYNDMPYFTITSICDGNHMAGSKHYEGKAFDFRTWIDNAGNQLPQLDKQHLKKALQDELGDDYDVVIESTHIHVEYDPK